MNGTTDDPLDQRLAALGVTVVVVNYNGRACIASCLEALCTDGLPWPVEILVVDNASTDGSDCIAEQYAVSCSQLRILRSPVNLGYAGGVNLALQEARGQFVAVLNMDVIVSPGWLAELVGFMEVHPLAGAVNPLLLLADDPGTVNAVGQDVHVTGLGFNRGLGCPANQLDTDPVVVSGIHGAAFVVRRELLELTGGLDETGFLYHEDVELSWLLQMMGYELFCIPRAQVLHRYALTMYPEKLFLLERNRIAMLLTYLQVASLGLLLPLLTCTEIMMWLYCCLRGVRFLRAKAASYAWVMAHRDKIFARRRFVHTLRRRSDWVVLRRLAWGYRWRQFLTLALERGSSRRQPTGGLPVKMWESR